MKMRKRQDLPQKVCATCGRLFAWRRKWRLNWEEVRHCSQRCRENRTRSGSSGNSR